MPALDAATAPHGAPHAPLHVDLDGEAVPQSDTIRLVSCLFAATQAPIVVEHDDEQRVAVTDPDYFSTHTDLSISPTTGDGMVSFFFGVMPDVDENAYLECALNPTAVLYKADTRTMIACWALDPPVSRSEAQEMVEVFGMDSLDEAIPLPPTGGWTLVLADPDTFYLYADVWDTYHPDAQENLDNVEQPAPIKYGDAIVRRHYDPTDPRYQQKAVISAANSKYSTNWKPVEATIAQHNDRLVEHRRRKKKDGPGFIPGALVGTQKTKQAVRVLTAVILDSDNGGGTSASIDAALDREDICAVRWSSYTDQSTHTKLPREQVRKFAGEREIDTNLIREYLREKKGLVESVVASAELVGQEQTEAGVVFQVSHDPISKNKVVAFLAEPFVVANEGDTLAEAATKWRKIYMAFAEKLGITQIDPTGADLNRFDYFPAHPEGRLGNISIWGGDLLDWRKLLKEPEDPFASFADDDKSKKSWMTKTPEGKALIGWHKKRGHGFQLASAYEAHASDKLRGSASSGGLTVECPYDEQHGNAGESDDKGCFVVNAGDGPSETFVFSCRHASCQELSKLDRLAKAIKESVLPESVLTDEEFNAVILEDEGEAEAGAKKDEAKGGKQGEAEAEYQIAIEALTPNSTQDEINTVADLINDANLARASLTKAIKSVSKKTGFLTTKDVKITLNERRKSAPLKAAKRGRKTFTYEGEFDFFEASEFCQKAIIEANAQAGYPRLSQLGGDVMRLDRERVIDAGVEKQRVGFVKMTERTMWSEVSSLVAFVRETDQGYGEPQAVDNHVAGHVYAQGYRYLPPMPEVLYTPLFLRTGSLLIKPGFHLLKADDLNALVILNGLVVPTVPEKPTAEQVAESLAWIKTELLSDFPFLDYDANNEERREPSEANALAMLITPFMRRMIDGLTPVFWVHKPTPGTGGTLLGQLPMWLFDGVAGSVTRYSQNEEEMQKGLIASVRERKSHLFFDDVKDFNNRELLRAITSPTISGRLLGVSKNIDIPNRFNWVGTGNNTIILEEMRRRIVFIRMNAKLPDIQNRRFRHPDISGLMYEQFVKQNRGIAVHHILTLIQHWISTGMVPFKERRRASFEDWSAKVGGVLQACGVEGFLDNLSVVEQDMDDGASKEFIRAVHAAFGETLKTPLELFNWSMDQEFDICEGVNDAQKKARFLRRLANLDGQTFLITEDKNCMLQRKHNKDGAVAFRVVVVVKATAEPHMKVAAE